jgi:hypothetical protein
MQSLEQILLASLFAGIVAIAVTVAIERLGGVVGGVLATVPSTIVPAAAFMWLGNPNALAFAAAMAMVPFGVLLNAVFLWLWRVVPPLIPETISFKARLASITVVNLLLWTIAATLLTLASAYLLKSWVSALHLGIVGVVLGIILGVVASLKSQPAPKGENKVGTLALMLRGVAAALAIGCAVWLAQNGSPLIAGIASVFPAIFTTSMVALWISQGQAVPSGAIGPMMLGVTSVSTYAVLAIMTVPAHGVILGSGLAWIGAVLIITLPCSYWLSSRQPAG